MLNEGITEFDERLVKATALDGIGFQELHCSVPLNGVPNGTEFTPKFQLCIARSSEDTNRFRVAITCELQNESGVKILVTAYGVYHVEDENLLPLEDKAIEEYVNLVAASHLMPYIRQAIADITSRVAGNSLTLPVYKLGDLHFRA